MTKIVHIALQYISKKRNLAKYIKNVIAIISLILLNPNSTIFCDSTSNNVSNKLLELQWIKDDQWSLKKDFLLLLTQLFNTTIFIETGSFFGGTTQAALPYFNKIHTIELSKKHYEKVQEKFKNNTSVDTYLGESSKVLLQILPHIKEKTLFWLDGHFSGGDTARGEHNTPIIQELEAIEKNLLFQPVILIDDIRCFDSISNADALKGYPSLKQVENAIKKINPDYEFVIFGDTAIAYHKNENIIVSPIIKACTASRLFTDDEYSLETVIEAERIIANANIADKTILKTLDQKLQGKHSAFWCGLILAKENNHNEAYAKFKKAISLGLDHRRVLWHLDQSSILSR